MFCGARTQISPTSPVGSVVAGVRVDDPQLDAGTGHAAGAQPVAVGPVEVVVLRRQVDDRAGGLGEPVGLPELAAERRDRAGEHLPR